MTRRRPGLWVAIGLNLALLTLAVSVLDAGVFFLVTRRALSDAASELALGTADILTDELAAVGPDGWKKLIDARRRSGTRELTLYATSGEVLAGEPTAAGPDVRAAFFSRETTTGEVDGQVEVIAPVGAPGPPAAVLRVRLPLNATAAPAWTVIGAHAVFSAVLIVVFGLVSFRRSLLLPIEELRDGTRRIAAGELGLQVSEDAPAEIAELAEALNGMSTALAGYRARTAEQLARLEAANVELRRTQDALLRSEKLASVGRLAAGLAHELGNPLTAVRGYVELLALGGVDSADEIVGRCQREVERMHRILRSLLDFARQEAPEVVEVDVAGLLEEAVRTVQHQGPFRAIELDLAVRAPRASPASPTSCTRCWSTCSSTRRAPAPRGSASARASRAARCASPARTTARASPRRTWGGSSSPSSPPAPRGREQGSAWRCLYGSWSSTAGGSTCRACRGPARCSPCGSLSSGSQRRRLLRPSFRFRRTTARGSRVRCAARVLRFEPRAVRGGCSPLSP
jgi:signal transduction histidine kinase